MISGMRVRRRSSGIGGKKTFKHYRLHIDAAGVEGWAQIFRLELLDGVTDLGPISGGTATVSSHRSSLSDESAPFNGTTSGYWGSPNIPPSAWISYEFPNPVSLSAYALTAGTGFNQEDRMPSIWQFQGSNDGVTWEDLDTQTGVTWASGQRREFPL